MADHGAGTPDHAGLRPRGSKLTRRQVLISSGAAATGLVALHTVDTLLAAGEAAPTPPILPGVVERIELPDTIHLRRLGERPGAEVVRLTPGATILRGIGGRGRELAMFRPGDEVVAEGTWQAGVFRATGVVSLFHSVVGVILRRTGDTIQTAKAEVRLTPETMLVSDPGFAAKPLAQLVAGDEVVGHAWRDPASGMLLAARIGMRHVH